MKGFIGYKYKPHYFYIIADLNRRAKLLSIGITSRTPKKRKNEYVCGYRYEILYSTLFPTWKKAYKFEQEMKQIYKNDPNFSQFGNTENFYIG